jgi:hypothetical protein
VRTANVAREPQAYTCAQQQSASAMNPILLTFAARLVRFTSIDQDPGFAKHNIRFEDAAAQRQHDGGDHNWRETPLFAASMERMALGMRMGTELTCHH